MAWWEQKGDTYYIYYRINGKKQKPLRTKDLQTRKILLKEAIDRETAARSGLPVRGIFRGIPWEDFKAKYFEYAIKRKGLKKQTIDRVKSFLRAFEGIITLQSTNDFTYANLERFIAQRSETVGKNTVDRDITIIKALSSYGVLDGLLPENVGAKVKKYNVYKGGVKDFLLLEEISRALKLSQDNKNLYTAISFAWYTGMRREELCYVDINRDINTNLCKVHITPKPDLGFNVKDCEARTIPFDPSLVNLVQQLRKENKSRWLLRNNKGDRLDPDSISRIARKFLHLHEFRTVINRDIATLHSFRHSYGTYLLHAGATLQEVKNLMGHSKISTTEIYLHTAEEYLKAAVSKLPNLPDLPSI